MAYTFRASAFILEHLGAEPGASISTQNATTASGGTDRLVDGKLAAPLEFAAAAADHAVEFDLGAAMSAGVLAIPAGHTLDGQTVEIFAGAAPAPAASQGSVVADAGPVILEFTPASFRYWRVTFSGNAAHRIPEMVLGADVKTLSRGVDPEWSTPIRSNVAEATFSSGSDRVTLGAARRVWELRHRRTGDTGDLDIWFQLQRLGLSRPIMFLPPDDSFDWVLVDVDADFDMDQEFPVPSLGAKYEARLRLVEAL